MQRLLGKLPAGLQPLGAQLLLHYRPSGSLEDFSKAFVALAALRQQQPQPQQLLHMQPTAAMEYTAHVGQAQCTCMYACQPKA